MIKEIVLPKGHKVIARDDHHWLKPGQVAYSLFEPGQTKPIYDECACDDWAHFERLLAKTIQIQNPL